MSFDGRRTDLVDDSYEYNVNLNTSTGKSYSMVLAGEAFYHIGYLEMYNTSLPDAVYDLVDITQNCDDIAMNVLVASYLESQGQPQCPGILVRGFSVKNLETEASMCFLFVYLCLSVCLFVCLSVCLSVCPFIHLPIRSPVCLFVYWIANYTE